MCETVLEDGSRGKNDEKKTRGAEEAAGRGTAFCRAARTASWRAFACPRRGRRLRHRCRRASGGERSHSLLRRSFARSRRRERNRGSERGKENGASLKFSLRLLEEEKKVFLDSLDPLSFKSPFFLFSLASDTFLAPCLRLQMGSERGHARQTETDARNAGKERKGKR